MLIPSIRQVSPEIYSNCISPEPHLQGQLVPIKTSSSPSSERLRSKFAGCLGAAIQIFGPRSCHFNKRLLRTSRCNINLPLAAVFSEALRTVSPSQTSTSLIPDNTRVAQLSILSPRFHSRPTCSTIHARRCEFAYFQAHQQSSLAAPREARWLAQKAASNSRSK